MSRARPWPTPREGRQPRQEPSVIVVQEAPAPVDERLKGLLPRHGRPPTAGEEPKAIPESRCDLFWRHCRDARGSELERERDAIEAAADLRDRRDVLVGELKRRLDRGGALGE